MTEQTEQSGQSGQSGQFELTWGDLGLTPLLMRILSVCWGREIVSHAELMKRAWGRQVPRINLDVAVHRLNRKLKGKIGLRLHVRVYDVFVDRGAWG